MKPTGLIRILLTSVFALLLAGGMMTAQAQQTVFVDKTNGSDGFTGGENDPFETIQRGLDEVSGGATGDRIIIRGGDYDESLTVAEPGLTFEVTERDDGVQNVEVTEFDFDPSAGETISVVSTSGGFFTIAAAGGIELSTGTLDVDASSSLRLASGALVTREDGEISGSAPQFAANTNVTYDPSADINAGLELPDDLGNGDLTIDGANTVTFNGDVTADNFDLANGASADFDGSSLTIGAGAVGGDVVVGGASTLTVDGTLTIGDTDTKLTVDGTFEGGDVTLSEVSVPGGSKVLVDGSGTATVGTLSAAVVSDDNGSDDTVQTFIRTSAASSDFTFTSVDTQTDGDDDETDALAVDIDMNAVASTVEVSSGTFRDVLSNGSGTLNVRGDITLTGTFANGGGTIDVGSGATLEVQGTPSTNNATNGVTGDGTIQFNGSAAQTVNNAGILPNVIADQALTLDGAGGADAVDVEGSLTANANVTIQGNGGTAAQAGSATIADGATVDVNGDGLTVNGAVTNNGTLEVDATGGTSLDASGAFTTSGTATLSGDANFGSTFASSGTTDISGNVSVAGATFTVSDGTTTLVGTRTLDAESVSFTGGALDLTNDAVTLGGSFTRSDATNPTLTSAGASLTFVGSAEASLNPGNSLRFEGDITINKPDITVTLGNDIRVDGTFTVEDVDVTPDFALDLGSNDIIMTEGGSTFDLRGNLTGTGRIVVENEGTIQGAGTYGNIAIADSDLGMGNNDITIGTDVDFSGTLSLINGGIDTNGNDISPVGDSASVSRSVAGTATDITGTGTFNNAGNPYDLSYVGAGGPVTTASELSTNVQDLTVTSGAQVDLDKDAGPGGTLTVAGTLNEGGGPFTVTLGGDNTSHSVSGFLNSELIVDADTVSVAGSDAGSAVSTLQDVTVNGVAASISDIKKIDGNLETNADASATVTLIDDQDSFTDPMTITGGVTLDGVRLTFGSDTIVQGGFAANNGAVEFMEHDVTMDTGNFAGASDASYTADGGGTLIIDSGADVGTDSVSVPNVTIESIGQLSSDVDVSETLVVRDGIASNGNNFSFSGEATLDNVATAFDGAGSFIADSSAVTVVGQTAAVSNFEVRSDTTTVSVGISDFTGSALDVMDTFTLTSGTLSHSASIELTGDVGGDEFIYTDGAIERTGGAIVLDNAAITFDLAKDVSIPWLTVLSTADLDDEENLTVSGQLQLDAQFLANDADADGQLVIGDGATILRTNGYTANDVLDEKPMFAGEYDLTYGAGNAGAYTSGFELDNSAESLQTLTINTTDNVFFEDDGDNFVTGDVTVNNTLNLTSGLLDYKRQVVIADSATVTRTGDSRLFDPSTAVGDGDDADPDALEAEGFYTLVYTGAADVTADAKEFLATGNVALETRVGDATNGVDYNVEIPFDRTVVNALIANTTAGSETILADLAPNFVPSTLTVTDTSAVSGGVLSNGTLAAQDDLSIAGATVSSFIDAEANTTVTAGAINGNLTTAGDVSFDSNSTFGGGTNLTFDGSGTQNVQLAGNITPFNVTLDQQGDEPRVEVTGGNITVTGQLAFDNGLFVTDGRVTLNGGFTRANVEENEVGHVVGTVRQFVNNGQAGVGRYEYPVGTDTATVDRESARYRPYTITFDDTDPPITQTNIDVTHVDESPEGTVGLPFTDDSGVTIGNYPDFFWLVDATTSLGSQQSFDVEMQGDNLGLPFDDEEDLRIIRRFDGNAQNNEYRLQGDPADYDNILSVETLPNAPDDSTVVVRNIGSRGGIVTQGARFTIGVPSRAPAFTLAPEDTLTVAEDSTLTADFQAEGRDIGSEISFSLDNAPENASIAPIPGHAGTLTATQSTVNESSPGSGTVSFGVTIEDDTISAINYTVEIDGLDASAFSGAAGTANPDDDIIGLHIHNAARGDTGPILFGILGSQNSPFSPDTTDDAQRSISVDGQSITITGTWNPDEGANPNALLDQLLPAVGEDVPLYANVHTTGNNAGEIRGQLTVQETARFTFTPDFDQAGTFDLATVVTDQTNGLTTRQPFTVVVEDNVPPFTLGSPSGDTTVTSIDATLVLQFVVGETEFDLAAQNAADVSGDGRINSADASLILQFVAGIIDEFPAAGNNAAVAAKATTMGDVSGRIDWGELQHAKAEQAMNLPLVLSGDAKNVRSMQITAEFDPSTMSVADVTPALPSGWQVAHNVDRESGTIRIAMAGSTPVGPGQVGTLTFETTSDDAEAQLSGSFQLNAGTESTIGTTTVRSLPSDFALKANYPNPVRQSTTIEYDLPEETQVTLSVYNVLGQRVATLVDEKMSAGQHEVSFDASRLSSGMYIYRIQAGSFTKSNRMTIVK